MADVLAFVEQRDGQIGGGAREVVSAAAQLASGIGGSATALVLGGPGLAAAVEGLATAGATSVAVGEHEALAEYNPEAYLRVVVNHVRDGDFKALILSATSLGKDLAPRVAAELDVPLASDVTGMDAQGVVPLFIRPVYSGKAFARVSIDANLAIITIRPNVFPVGEYGAECHLSKFTPDVDPATWRVRVIERKDTVEGVVDVSEAAVVISGGRGMKDPANWGLLQELRDVIGPDAALGASRAVVDAGWRPHAEQVGQTGKTVAPRLYIAVGISGAIQHLAGMRTSQTIVAVNRDPDAPILSMADYGIVGDLFEVLPRMTEEIKALKSED